MTFSVHECPDGIRKSPSGYIPLFGKYYKAFNDKRDFYGALEVCQKEKGTLLEYRTYDEFKAAKIMLGQYLDIMQRYTLGTPFPIRLWGIFRQLF